MKIQFTAVINRFNTKGEKTGWTYIDVPSDVTLRLKPGNKKSFRVKGMLDQYVISGIALLPMGEGNFIMALNAVIRKNIGKKHGAVINVQLEVDTKPIVLDEEFLQCLDDEPSALKFFNQLPKSHQNYFSKWIAGAKTSETKTKRIAQALNGLSNHWNFSMIMQAAKKK